jgi:hypothetical protein
MHTSIPLRTQFIKLVLKDDEVSDAQMDCLHIEFEFSQKKLPRTWFKETNKYVVAAVLFQR